MHRGVVRMTLAKKTGGVPNLETRRFFTEKSRETFAASDISSVIALEKSEKGSERTKAEAKIRKR
jgi:hypothetical protein